MPHNGLGRTGRGCRMTPLHGKGYEPEGSCQVQLRKPTDQASHC